MKRLKDIILSEFKFYFKPHDDYFKILIDKEFKDELRILEKYRDLLRIPSWSRTEKQDEFLENYKDSWIIDHIKKKYKKGYCTSHLFPKVSKNLQIQYQIIQNRINNTIEDIDEYEKSQKIF